MSKLEAPCVVKVEAPEITHIPSLQQEVQKTLSWLGDKESFTCIRIFGMVGTGKTTILKTINNHPLVSEIFDFVIWLQLGDGNSKNKTVDELKKVLLERLRLVDTLADNPETCIDTELRGKRYLLLLDDVCGDLVLKEIGILTQEDGNKVVLTTRRQHICSSIVNQQIRVGMLKEDEALCLFKNVLNRDFDGLFTSAMRRIVNMCGYNPLMIKAAGRYFRTLETLGCWNMELSKL